MGILELLTIIFVVLKLIGVIDWTWFQVLIPLMISIGMYVIAFGVWLFAVVFGFKGMK